MGQITEVASDTADDVREGGESFFDKVKHVADQAWKKTKDVAGTVAEKAGPTASKAWDKTKDVAGTAKDKVTDLVKRDKPEEGPTDHSSS